MLAVSARSDYCIVGTPMAQKRKLGYGAEGVKRICHETLCDQRDDSFTQ